MCLPDVLKAAVQQGRSTKRAKEDAYEAEAAGAPEHALLLLTRILAIRFKEAAENGRFYVCLRLQWGQFALGTAAERELAVLQTTHGKQPIIAALDSMGLEYHLGTICHETGRAAPPYDPRVSGDDRCPDVTISLPQID